MDGIAAEVNDKLEKEVAAQRRRKRQQERELAGITSEADALLTEWSRGPSEGARTFLGDKLDGLAERRSQVAEALECTESAIKQLEGSRVESEVVRLALAQTAEVFGRLQPYQRRELARLILHRAEVVKNGVRLAFYGSPPDVEAYLESKMAQSLPINSEPPKTLPRLDSNQ